MHLRHFVSFVISAASLVSAVAVGQAKETLPIERVEYLYKNAEPEQAREALVNCLRNMQAYVRVETQRSKRVDLAVKAMKRMIAYTKRALKLERSLAHQPKDHRHELALLSQCRKLILPALKEIEAKDTLGEKRAKQLVQEITADVGELIRSEIDLLQKAERAEQAQALSKEHARLLKTKRPKLTPDDELFIIRSRARPGPLQVVDACYRLEVVPEGRKRFLKLLAELRKQAGQVGKAKSILSSSALLPKRMVEHTNWVMAWERGQTAEMTRDTYFPSDALPVLQEAVRLTAQALADLSKVQGDERFKAHLGQSKESCERLRGFERVAIQEVQERSKAAQSTKPRPAPGQDFRRARVVTPQDLEICRLVNEFYSAMASGKQSQLDAVLATGEGLATGKDIADFLADAKRSGRIDRIVGYRVVPATRYYILDERGALSVAVHGLQARIVVRGKLTVSGKSDRFRVVKEKSGLRLAFPKSRLERDGPEAKEQSK